ncbi:MAG: Mov34/MPN/PAD-1 family protein [Methanomassiliicoccales archaeon]
MERFREGEIALYVSKVAEEKMRNHSLSSAPSNKEVMGFLLGQVFQMGGDRYALVRDVVTTDLEASSVQVRFDRSSYESLFSDLEECGFDYLIVGWYHSHPGHGCFMSSTDIETQRTMFPQPYHGALVLDPVNREIEAFRLSAEGVEVIGMAVFWEEYQDPYGGRMVRKRRSHPDRVPPAKGGLALTQALHEDRDQ